MEPASIVGLVGSVTSLVFLSGKIAKGIHDLLDKYGRVATRLVELKDDCSVLETGFSTVKHWLERNRHITVSERASLEACLMIFNEALAALDSEISALTAGGKAAAFVDRLGTRKKLKYLWDEDIVVMHYNRVRATRDNLQFLLVACNL